MPQWRCPHSSPPPSTACRGPIGRSTVCPTGGARTRLSAALRGPTKELHRKPKWRCPHASPPPSAAL
eukprot:7208898-Pyramimonas_sp.AAC.1